MPWSQFSEPPDDIVQLLKNQKAPETLASSGNEFCVEKNTAISKVLTDSVPQLKLVSLILWFRIYNLLGDHLASNVDEILVNAMLRKHLTDLIHHLYLDIIGSAKYRRELRALFQVEDLIEAHLSIGSVLCLDTFTFFVHHLVSKIDLRHETEQINFYVSDMPLNACLAKLRHGAGWAVRKELERCRRFIRQNMFSKTTETRQNVYAAYAKCELLEERIIVQFAWLKDNTSAPRTLEVTEHRQYKERGLLHISDEAFGCFKILENLSARNEHVKIDGFNPESQLYRHCCPTILRDSTLSSAWKALFKDIEPHKEVSITFEKLCGLPVKMCC